MNLPAEIYLVPQGLVLRQTYCALRSEEFSEKYKSSKAEFSPETIEYFIQVCVNEGEMDEEEYQKEHFLGQAEVCEDIYRTQEMTKKTTIIPNIDQLDPSKKVKPEDVILEPASPAVASDDPQRDEDADALPTPKEVNTQEILILKAAMETRLDNGGYSDLAKSYTFSDDMSDIRLKDGAIESPMMAGALMGLGADLGRRGFWILVTGAQKLMVLGHEHAMEQICASLKLNSSSVYNYLRTLPYVTAEARKLLNPTVLVELCCGKYSDDEKVNDEIKKKLVKEAVANGYDTGEARSAKLREQGKEINLDPTNGKPKFILIMPGQEPMGCREEPVFSEGCVIINLKTLEIYKDIENRLEWCKMAVEPTMEELSKILANAA